MNGGWYTWGSRADSSPDGVLWARMAAHREALPRPGRQQRDLAVDSQHHQQRGRQQHPRALPRGGQGASYVDWVGIDGYYLKPNWKFAPLFGPTITAVKRLKPWTRYLSPRQGAVPAAGQPSKIADLFSGIHQ